MPAEFRAAFVACAFLGSDGVLGENFREASDNRPFAAPVSLGHQVDVPFVMDVRRKGIFFTKNFAGFKSGFDRNVEIVGTHKKLRLLSYQFSKKRKNAGWSCAGPFFPRTLPQWNELVSSGRSPRRNLFGQARFCGADCGLSCRCRCARLWQA